MRAFSQTIGAALLLLPAAADARDALGMFGEWGAFHDANPARCYAIGMAIPSALHRDFQPWADVAIWKNVGGQVLRGQVHFRLSRKLMPGGKIDLALGGQHFMLTGGGADAWGADKRMDADITSAMRSAADMVVSAKGTDGKGFSNTWKLDGVASAMDAAALGCANGV